MRCPRLLRLSYLAWLAVPTLAYGVYAAFGLPHVIWSYDWRPIGPNSYAEFDRRHYTRCAYLGPYGLITEYPLNGTCGWIRFRAKREQAR